jgi:molybdopterin molybdotransferase
MYRYALVWCQVYPLLLFATLFKIFSAHYLDQCIVVTHAVFVKAHDPRTCIMISYEDAKAIILQNGRDKEQSTHLVPLEQSVGSVCATDVKAPINIQAFDNSAMDGFAIRRDGLEEDGGALINTGLIAAGDPVPDVPLNSGECIEIMTGAPMPPGADAVVPVENIEVNSDRVTIKKTPDAGDHIRYAGADFKAGMDVLSSGDLIHPQHIMPLAALGVDKVHVYKRVKVALLMTGDELVEDLSQELKSGQIYNSNRPYSLAALEAMGVDCAISQVMPDRPDLFSKLLHDLSEQDVDCIISSGAVSAGKFDFVRKGLEDAGAEILFHKVKIKPGKPNLFARLPNGTLYFGLPGNPVSTTAGLRFFVEPCLRAMMNREGEKPVRAIARSAFKKRGDLRMFLKAHVSSDEEGRLNVELLDGQASFMVRPFLSMNCWAVAPENTENIAVGDCIDIYPLYPHAGLV